jgi:syntaxin-binding protein 1
MDDALRGLTKRRLLVRAARMRSLPRAARSLRTVCAPARAHARCRAPCAAAVRRVLRCVCLAAPPPTRSRAARAALPAALAAPDAPAPLAAAARARVQEEMLHSVRVVNDEWRVLVVDDVTVKVFSAACKLSDVTEENVSRARPGGAAPRRARLQLRACSAPGRRVCAAWARCAPSRARRAAPDPRARAAVVEDLSKRRAPMPHRAGARAAPRAPCTRCTPHAPPPAPPAIYFISPTERSVRQLIEDFAGPVQMYKKAHVFFSNSLDRRLLSAIKNSGVLLERLGTLKEFNMEYTALDSRAFCAGTRDDLSTFYSAGAHQMVGYEDAMQEVVSRLASLFASLKEAPSVRFRAGRSGGERNESAAMREQMAGRVAGMLCDKLTKLQASLPDMPQAETCDLLILDRGCDPVAPLVHDWSYECLCHDLLRMRGPLYRYRYENNAGKPEEKDVALDESDALFRELRSLHLADVLSTISERMAVFTAQNKGAAARAAGAQLSVSQMKKMVEALPQYQQQLQKLSVHTTVTEELNSAVKLRRLNEVGTLEQELVFGDATSKDLLRLLESLRGGGSATRMDALASEATALDRLRLMMCYFGTHAEKLDVQAGGVAKWKAAGGLAPDDMGAILNLELLGCAVTKRPKDAPKSKKASGRRKPPPNEEGWDLPKFVPRVAELAAELVRGELSQEAFPYVNPPMDAAGAARVGGAVPGRSARSGGAQSVRSTRTAAGATAGTGTWAARRGGDSLGLDGLRLGGAGPRARRLVIFILGPISYTEVRAAHELSKALGRDVFVGGTSLAPPEEFVAKLKALRSAHGGAGADDDEDDY